MNKIDIKKNNLVDNQFNFTIIIDNREFFDINVNIENNVATIKYNADSTNQRGFYGALLLNDLLDYVMKTIDGVIEVRTYFDNDLDIANYSDQFNFKTKQISKDKVCCFLKK